MNEVILGDFREHSIPDEAFFISDPPYNQKYHYSTYGDNLPTDEYCDLLWTAFKGKKSVVILYPEETINLLGGGVMGGVQQVVSWVYNSNTAKQSRLISWFGCKPDMTKIPQAYKNPTDKRIAKRIADGKSARGYDWWNINQVKNVSKKDNPHPCPIPYELAEKIILATTREGDLVCDPFAGSGTVLLAARNNGRRWLGFEIDKTYYDYSVRLLT